MKRYIGQRAAKPNGVRCVESEYNSMVTMKVSSRGLEMVFSFSWRSLSASSIASNVYTSE